MQDVRLIGIIIIFVLLLSLLKKKICVGQSDGKPEELRGREYCAELGRLQDPLAGGQPFSRQLRYFWKRSGRHSHAQIQALPENACVHKHDDSREQQDPNVRSTPSTTN